jgi:hypothetical protein
MHALPARCRAIAARTRQGWASAGFVLAATTLSLAGCSQPDTVALKRLACEQAGANLDLQSLSQLDALRKALGLARDVDPIGYCRSIGARLEPLQPAPGADSEGAEQPGQSE